MKKYIEIKGDTNDGDYVSERTEVTDAQIEEIKPVIEAIKNSEAQHGFNFDTSEYQNNDAEEVYGNIDGFSMFRRMVPHGEHGIHSIDSIIILEAKETKLI